MKKSYVMIDVIKHDMDPNSNINYHRKIGPLSTTLLGACLSTSMSGYKCACRQKTSSRHVKIVLVSRIAYTNRQSSLTQISQLTKNNIKILNDKYLYQFTFHY